MTLESQHGGRGIPGGFALRAIRVPARMARLSCIPTRTAFFCWSIVDERNGKRRLTRYAMTRERAPDRSPAPSADLADARGAHGAGAG